MKRYLKIIIGAIAGVMFTTSCSDYLDVKPENQFLEETMFSTEIGIQTVLNGIYLDMTSQSLYGGNLTMSTVDIMGQLYKTKTTNGSPHGYQEIQKINFESFESNLNSIWTSAYVNILNINNFIIQLEARNNMLPEAEKKIVLGEAYALRAMHHFDLLRLFGPVYQTSPEAFSIPYNTTVETTVNSLLPATKVAENVLADLATAESLLENDPIREFGKVYTSQDVELSEDNPLFEYKRSDFYRFRNKRFNYYAVKALQARVNLYAGNNAEALAAGKLVIDEASQWFPWSEAVDVISAGADADRIFSDEVIFGLENNNLYTTQQTYFGESLQDEGILSVRTDRQNMLYENDDDYRSKVHWAAPSQGQHGFDVFVKYLDTHDNRKEFRFLQPLIRISEMYLIAAELESDEAIALTYINEFRKKRGIEGLGLGTGIQTEIMNEYRREFYGEGQMFFYYKRKNMNEILNANTAGTMEMGIGQYVAPLPKSESDYR